ncbi:MAG: TfoX/Sxy family protein [Nitrospirae bacterium]|nr:TfoX/Sxy family protein [Nitrospirota bacterium]
MTASIEYTEYVLELLEPIGPVRTGRFFGGVGISNGSVQFAMIMGNSLYFAVDEDTRKKYEQAGMQPFSYMTKKGRVQVRKYFELRFPLFFVFQRASFMLPVFPHADH